MTANGESHRGGREGIRPAYPCSHFNLVTMKPLTPGQPQLLSRLDKYADTQPNEWFTKFAAMCFGICFTSNGQGGEQVGWWVGLTVATAARNQSFGIDCDCGSAPPLSHCRLLGHTDEKKKPLSSFQAAADSFAPPQPLTGGGEKMSTKVC